MSEYQYHEWQSVDRVLTPNEQAAVDRLSSHIEVSPSKAVVTYNWGDFKHDPRQVLLDYFDAYFYLANWGSRRLMFRFPKGLLDETELNPYLSGEFISFETAGRYQVLDIDYNPEDGELMEEMDAELSDFIHLRADLLQGDYRLLYLVWLVNMAYYAEPENDEEAEYEDDGDEEQGESSDNEDILDNELEPPVPPGLKTLSPALHNFVRTFGIDPYLVQAAAEASPDLKDDPSVDYLALVAGLSRSECNDFLARLAEGDAGVGLALRKRLSGFLPQELPPGAARKRSYDQLLKRAQQIEKAEDQRRAAEARKKHIAEMKALAGRENQVWQEVDNLLENGRRIASVYDEATRLLESLKELSEFQDTRDIFRVHVRNLANRYASRPSLIERWRKHGWL